MQRGREHKAPSYHMHVNRLASKFCVRHHRGTHSARPSPPRSAALPAPQLRPDAVKQTEGKEQCARRRAKPLLVSAAACRRRHRCLMPLPRAAVTPV